MKRPHLILSLMIAMAVAFLACEGQPEVGAGDGVAIEAIVEPDVGFYQELSWSPDGGSLLVSVLKAEEAEPGFSYRIYRINVDGSGWSRVTDGPMDYWTSWSPDGSRIAFASRADDNADILVSNPDGSERTRLTRDPGVDTHPAWSPDGTEIAFISRREGIPRIYVMNADGSGARPVGETQKEPGNPEWSPNGTLIVYYETDPEAEDYIYVMKADGSGRTRITAGVWPAWSPDGSKIIYGAEGGLYTVKPDGSEETRLIAAENMIYGRFSPDGSMIAYITQNEGFVEVRVRRADGAQDAALLRRPAPVW